MERLAETGKIDDFFDAIDSDDFVLVKWLMKQAHIDPVSIAAVLKMMADADGKN